MSTYSVVGVSRLNGEVKVRFAHDIMYVKGLAKAGNTDIELVEAPSAMEKPALVEFLKTTTIYQNPEFKEAIDDRADMYAKLAKTADGVVKATVPKVAKQPKAPKATDKAAKLAELVARAAEVEQVAEPVAE